MFNKQFNHSQTSLFDGADSQVKGHESMSHAAFVEIIRMNQDDIKNLEINYRFQTTRFGNTLLASTSLGICYLGFFDHEKDALSELKNRFPSGNFTEQVDEFQQNALLFFENDWSKQKPIQVHLLGTDFQLNVWEMLLKIPLGATVSYGELATALQMPNGSRAVGTAIGKNPIAYLIPCHRVVQTSGALGGYMWGLDRKKEILMWERSLIFKS